jgi:hypothetical protein
VKKMRGEPGSIEWAVATIATSLAVGTPTRVVSPGELEDAAGVIVGALREAGQDRVLMPTGVWNLVALAEGEELVFAREAVARLFDWPATDGRVGPDIKPKRTQANSRRQGTVSLSIGGGSGPSTTLIAWVVTLRVR